MCSLQQSPHIWPGVRWYIQREAEPLSPTQHPFVPFFSKQDSRCWMSSTLRRIMTIFSSKIGFILPAITDTYYYTCVMAIVLKISSPGPFQVVSRSLGLSQQNHRGDQDFHPISLRLVCNLLQSTV